MSKRFLGVLAGVALLAAALACNPLTPSVEQILANSADAMQAVETVGFEINMEDAPLVISEADQVTLLSLEGVYEAPDDVFVTARINVQGMVTEAEFVWKEQELFGRIPGLQDNWEQVEGDVGWQPSDIFDESEGLPAVLRDNVAEAELVGTEEVEGVNTYHVTGKISASDIANLLGEDIADDEDQEWDVELWIDTKTFQLVKMTLSAEGDTWEAIFYEYGEAVDIPNP